MGTNMLEQALVRAASHIFDGDFFMGERLLAQLVAQNPVYPEAHNEFAGYKLLQGLYEEAWPYFQRRIDSVAYQAKGTTQLQAPYWEGQSLPESTVFIHRDQGYGDLFMCARYISLVKKRVKAVKLMAPPGSGRMFRHAFPDIEILEDGDPVPMFDFHLHSFSLPAVFKTTLNSIPDGRVLKAEPELVEKWRHRLAGDFKVGICWQGNPAQARDTERSIPLKALEPLLRTDGVKFYGLHVGVGEAQIGDLDTGLPFVHLGPDLKSEDAFINDAAVIANLDLVITIDTAIAHLAGAMGAPVWVLLPKVPYWPYLLEGQETPWYPSAKLFRNLERDNWSNVEEEVKSALSMLIETR